MKISNAQVSTELLVRYIKDPSADHLAAIIDAARAGCFELLYIAGNAFETGTFSSQPDYEKALHLYEESIEKCDDLDSKLGKARVLLQVNRVNEGVETLLKMASQEIPEAQIMLGKLFQQGNGVTLSYEVARQNYAKAIKKGYVFPMLCISSLERENRRPFRAALWRIRAAIYAFIFSLRNVDDKRLWQVSRPD